MLDWLKDIFLPLFLLKALAISFCYICLSFHLYRIGIDERNVLKKRSALVTLLTSLPIFILSVYWLYKVDKSVLQLLFPFLF